jgi:serine/threonine protein kinase
MPERAVALIAYEVLKVVSACHAINVLHGDIKPANFVLRHRQVRTGNLGLDMVLFHGAQLASARGQHAGKLLPRATGRRGPLLRTSPAACTHPCGPHAQHASVHARPCTLQRNPLVSGDLTYLFTPWLAAIDLGCSQYLGPEVGAAAGGEGGLDGELPGGRVGKRGTLAIGRHGSWRQSALADPRIAGPCRRRLGQLSRAGRTHPICSSGALRLSALSSPPEHLPRSNPALPSHPKRFSKRTGTPVYMAPEIFERDYYVEADM